MKTFKIALTSALMTFFNYSLSIASGGLTPETAVKATMDTSNVADVSKGTQYYYFTADYTGYMSVGNCGLTSFDTRFYVIDSITGLYIAYNDDYCNYQSHEVFKVDSGVPYIIVWSALENTGTFKWYLTKYEPQPGEVCTKSISLSSGINHITLENSGKWYSYSSAKKGNLVFCSGDPFLNNVYVYSDCDQTYVYQVFLNDSTFAFNSEPGVNYVIYISNYGNIKEFDLNISEDTCSPGDRCETAQTTELGSNRFHSGLLPHVFYTYQAKTNSKLTLDICSVADSLTPRIYVKKGLCNEETDEEELGEIYYSCGKEFVNIQSCKFFADSGEYYSFRIKSKSNVSFDWNLTSGEPYAGEYFQSAINVKSGDTIEFPIIKTSSGLWYKLVPDSDKMYKISSCGMGNKEYDLYYMLVYKDSVEQYNEYKGSYQNTCESGMELEFSVDSGHVYYIYLMKRIDTVSIVWNLSSRNFIEGDVCSKGIVVQKGTENLLSAGDHEWYDYTPSEDEYVTFGISRLFNSWIDFTLKQDCDCKPIYDNINEGCTSFSQFGKVFSLTKGVTYHISVDNRYNEDDDIYWSAYYPTDIMDFQASGQIDDAEIDHKNHKISITVDQYRNIRSLSSSIIKPENVDLFINGILVYENFSTDYTNPVVLTARYINSENEDTLVQDWTIIVTQQAGPPPGPYAVKSDYLKNPELNKSRVTEWASFWKKAYDKKNGGFFTDVDREGNPTSTLKTLLSQSRDAYAFARAFMISGDTSYLSYADGALQFMYNHLWDKQYGGWITEEGLSESKWSFMQHYANLGIVAMSDAVGGARFSDNEIKGTCFNENEHWNMLNRSLDTINKYLWDSRPDYYGYYNYAEANWSNPYGKGFTPTVDGITTHGLYMYLLTKDPFFKNRLEQLANNIEGHLIPGMESAVMGFPEAYSSDWVMENGGDKFIGHMFKTAWCLARAYLESPQERYRTAARKLMYDLIDNGAYDYNYGAPFTGYDWETGYINTDTKEWWDVEQAYTSGIMNYYISDKEEDRNKFIEVADGSIDFFMNHFEDKEYGEVYATTNAAGDPNGTDKGNYWKAGYHSTEFAYYAYLYGNLFYTGKPIELYYFIDKTNKAQKVSLYPLAIEDDLLKMESVQLNGTQFTNFEKDTRTLNIAANQGGIFKVTFRNNKFAPDMIEPIVTNNDNDLNVDVYPNPVVNDGIIEYSVKNVTDVLIEIADLSGRVLYSSTNKNVMPGSYREIINREKLGKNSIVIVNVQTNKQKKTLRVVLFK